MTRGQIPSSAEAAGALSTELDNEPLITTAAPSGSKLRQFTREIGLQALIDAPSDVRILCFQRVIRMLAYGQATLILTLYFSALGFSDELIGFFMTATLFGDVGISFILTMFADALGRRRVLIIGCALMCFSGIVFAISDNFWILLVAAIAGVISPSGNEVGPFRAVEESTLAHLVPPESRSDIYSWYALLGRLGAAVGTVSCGTLVQALQQKAGWSNVRSYRFIYIFYSTIAVIKLYTSYHLSDACELDSFLQRNKKWKMKANDSNDDDETAEDALLLESTEELEEDLRDEVVAEEGGSSAVTRESKWRRFLPQISARSRKTLLILIPLFSMDAFGQGLVNNSWLTYYFSEKFGIHEASLGGMFFIGNFFASLGALIAASTAKRLGIVQTMVATHVPSSIILGLIPITNSFPVAIFLFAIRSGTNMMDTAPRQVFISSIVLKEERTSVMGLANVFRTLSQSIGPSITGAFAQRGKMWISFEIAMTVKVLYDVGILGFFLKEKLDRS
ncbi:major facilitator superfamily domain-containing protein [Limtongia smithiae]|uniref:major facilitator superfamily domain-containing protein n=1 Tax=Limtongia smithiae TaxID=1125753 RepID=UPI0034CE4F8E